MSFAFGSASDSVKVEKEVKETTLFLKEVHPRSNEIIGEIEDGTALVPPGYRLFQLRKSKGDNDKVRSIILSARSIIGVSSVQNAKTTRRKGEILVRLTQSGGSRLNNATKKMNLGKDRLAVVINGKCHLAPTVMAALNREFVIAGLDGKDEARHLADSLMAASNKADKAKEAPKK